MKAVFRGQRGFGVIAAIVVLVMLSALAAAIVAMSSTQGAVLAQDALSARAEQTAHAGTEWGLAQAVANANVWGGSSCNNGSEASPVSATVDTSAINGFQATVTCWSYVYREGETSPGTARQVRVYQLTSIACPAAPCPQAGAATAAVGYAERRREAVAVCTDIAPCP